MIRSDLIKYVETLEPINDSNLKFINMMKSQLVSARIPVSDAYAIVACMTFDLGNVNEDDCFIGDLAVAYADYCVKVYNKLKLHGLINHALFPRLFNRVYLKVDQ